MVLRMTPEEYAIRQARNTRTVSGVSLPGHMVTYVGSKYRNKRTDGYASQHEAKRAAELKLMLRAGQIRNLREQVPYLLVPKQDGEQSCSYIADFVYELPDVMEKYLGTVPQVIVEDCKGMKTPLYILKRKLMLFVHGIRIVEI